MILRACPYYTMFPLDFPLAWLRRARPGEWVLDPFCGRGTTLYCATGWWAARPAWPTGTRDRSGEARRPHM
jgi:hypothetical protein